MISKRSDGYHNLETVFYPVYWREALEVIENTASAEKFSFSQTGLAIAGPLQENTIYKAWELITKKRQLPNLHVHLHKILPMGAGLGGGSADVAFFIRLVNQQFDLRLTEQEEHELAASVGSDCSFFLRNKPAFATGRGNELSDIHCQLNNYYILLVKPDVHSNTRDAYAGLSPQKPARNLREIIENTPVSEWRDQLKNDFEASIFQKYPLIENIKHQLYEMGAIYASMSGSGSAVYGLFQQAPHYQFPDNYHVFLQTPGKKIL